MSDQPENTPANSSTPSTSSEHEPGWWAERFERARRLAEDDLLKRLGVSDIESVEKALKQISERDEAEKLKRGEFEGIINELKPQAERAKTLEKTLTAYYEAEIADIPEEKRKLIPSGDIAERLQWVKMAKAEGLFGVQPKAPNLDAGAQGDRKPNLKITPGQQSAASIASQFGYNISPEAIAKRAQEQAAERRNRTTEED